ncbi:RNA 3'-terminal phosphate cyclase [Desulfonema limicola]|uniref:RNA 3'-terminal phosphate cyclase n=1 Tax=Desulfonema limicola TaxID=45656 RepID=A0A975BB54_9BACT|nr:RNA 3'-terminal phosphate cyclase [Desulfonema limicola]QTA81999.1 RNA 3'-terminal phosphate cyclase [Desulfonema limicola]
MIIIDGSHGEGGGQILRSSLVLSMITGTPFQINKIRANRKKPGLMHQHLTALNAAAKIGNAEVTGNFIASSSVKFVPGTISPGNYHFAVGTAGSCTLVLQTILPALLTAKARSSLILEGGTHNPFAPPFDFLEKTFLPVINKMGASVKANLECPGFYPAGGGKFVVNINPAKTLSKIDIMERGLVKKSSAKAVVAKLPLKIAAREIKVVKDKLSWDKDLLYIEEIKDAKGPGNILSIEIESENITEVITGFGQKGITAEKVAGKAVKAAKEYLEADIPVGSYLADQLLIPMALAGGGRFLTLVPSSHTLTNAEILKRFLDINILISQRDNKRWEIEIK